MDGLQELPLASLAHQTSDIKEPGSSEDHLIGRASGPPKGHRGHIRGIGLGQKSLQGRLGGGFAGILTVVEGQDPSVSHHAAQIKERLEGGTVPAIAMEQGASRG